MRSLFAARSGEFAGLAPTMDSVHVHICDFYRLRGDRLAYNWMMIDVVDLLRQVRGERQGAARAGWMGVWVRSRDRIECCECSVSTVSRV